MQHKKNPSHDNVLNGLRLSKTDQEYDLGVLTSNSQMKESIRKANQMICWIVRNLILREKSVMVQVPNLKLVYMLVQPSLRMTNIDNSKNAVRH